MNSHSPENAQEITAESILAEISDIKALLKEIEDAQPHRAEWNDFPDVLILKEESMVRQDPLYSVSKAGDTAAAATMLKDLLTPTDIDRIQAFIKTCTNAGELRLAAVHTYESNLNAIPSALARISSEESGITHAVDVWQSNIVSHTGADGFGRLARQALFAGTVERGNTYILVDDFVGQVGTLANLRGHILEYGGQVATAFVLAGKPYSAKLAPYEEQLNELRKTHGEELEQWWKDYFGHSFDRHAQSEAWYFARSQNVDRIRKRIIAAKRPRDFEGHYRGPEAQRQRLRQLQAELKTRFPNGAPSS